MDKETFLSRLGQIKEAEGATGARYVDIHITRKGNSIMGVRASSNTKFSIYIDHLYEAYRNVQRLSTSEVRKYVFMAHSPALAILKRIKELDSQNNSDLPEQ